MSYDKEAHDAARLEQDLLVARMVARLEGWLARDVIPSPYNEYLRGMLVEYDRHEATMRATLGVKP